MATGPPAIRTPGATRDPTHELKEACPHGTYQGDHPPPPEAPASVVDTAPDAEGIDAACHTKHGYISDTSRYLTRLKRIEGQVRGIHRMVEEEQYCIDILTQVSALNRALESVALGLLDDHLKHCVADAAAQGGPVAKARIKEASDAIARLVGS